MRPQSLSGDFAKAHGQGVTFGEHLCLATRGRGGIPRNDDVFGIDGL
jgi:hypothetical protein